MAKKFKKNKFKRTSYYSGGRSSGVFSFLSDAFRNFNLGTVVVVGLILYLLFGKKKGDKSDDVYKDQLDALDNVKFDANNVAYSADQFSNMANILEKAFDAFTWGGTDYATIYGIVEPLNCDELNALRVTYGTRKYRSWPWSPARELNLDTTVYEECGSTLPNEGTLPGKILLKFQSCPI